MKKLIVILILAVAVLAIAPQVHISIKQPVAGACNPDSGFGC